MGLNIPQKKNQYCKIKSFQIWEFNRIYMRGKPNKQRNLQPMIGGGVMIKLVFCAWGSKFTNPDCECICYKSRNACAIWLKMQQLSHELRLRCEFFMSRFIHLTRIRIHISVYVRVCEFCTMTKTKSTFQHYTFNSVPTHAQKYKHLTLYGYMAEWNSPRQQLNAAIAKMYRKTVCVCVWVLMVLWYFTPTHTETRKFILFCDLFVCGTDGWGGYHIRVHK